MFDLEFNTVKERDRVWVGPNIGVRRSVFLFVSSRSSI